MSTLGDIPVPVTLTRDRVRLIRGLIYEPYIGTSAELPDELADVLVALNNAEDVATVKHAKGYSHFDLWE